jgi:hypothetical protein
VINNISFNHKVHKGLHKVTQRERKIPLKPTKKINSFATKIFLNEGSNNNNRR